MGTLRTTPIKNKTDARNIVMCQLLKQTDTKTVTGRQANRMMNRQMREFLCATLTQNH